MGTEPHPSVTSSHQPEGAVGAGRADAAADALEGQAPGSGHLQHMPGHTYSREGRWADYAAANIGRKTDFIGVETDADGALTADTALTANGMFAYGTAHNIAAGIHGASTDGQLSMALFGARELRRDPLLPLLRAATQQTTHA